MTAARLGRVAAPNHPASATRSSSYTPSFSHSYSHLNPLISRTPGACTHIQSLLLSPSQSFMAKGLHRPKVLALLLLLAKLTFARPTAISSLAAQSIELSDSPLLAQKDASIMRVSTPGSSSRDHGMPHHIHSADVYALDPFGFLGGNQPEETRSREGPPVSSSSVSSKAETSTEQHTSISTSTVGSSTSTITSNSDSSPADEETVLPSWTPTTSAEASSDSATPTDNLTPKQTTSNASQASSGMNSWKIIGIGIVTFVGVLTLIIGFTFHDSWWNNLLRPMILGRRNKNDGIGEELIPDWRRRSWGFGVDEKEGAEGYPGISGVLKVNIGQGLHSSNTLVDGNDLDEKAREASGNLAFPLPPVSPFPLRRSPSTKSNSESKAMADSGGQKLQQDIASILPSPPPVHAPNRSSLNAIGLPSVYQYNHYHNETSLTKDSDSPIPRANRRSRASLRASKSDFGRTNSVYGGIA